MSSHKYDSLDQQIRAGLKEELNQLHLSQEQKEEMIRSWKLKRQSPFQKIRAWGEEEVTVTLPGMVAACLVFMILLGGALWLEPMQQPNEYRSLENEELTCYKVVRTIHENGRTISETGQIYIRRRDY